MPRLSPPSDRRPRRPADVSQDPVAVGGSIRGTRKLKGLKLREMADQIGCSESLLSKIENGRISPSLAVLGKIAKCLQISVAELFSPDESQKIVFQAGSRQVLSLHGAGSSVERLVPPDGDHLLEGNLHTLQPGAGSRAMLSHEGEEVGYVIEGEFELTVGQQVFTLGAGDSFTFRSEARHAYRNPGKVAARIIWVSTPSRSSATSPGSKPKIRKRG
ncbi:MAG: transcriptional regulator [Ramlibacter sp.]|nr:transcriptional regulator [Ramlibacter sp.]